MAAKRKRPAPAPAATSSKSSKKQASASASVPKKKPGHVPLPASWQPPSAPVPPGKPFHLQPDELYPTGTYWEALPVFKPTWEEFKDFYTYVRRISKEGMTFGIVKIVPPKEWLDMQPDLSDRLDHIRIKTPLQQIVQSAGEGTYQQTNTQVQRDFTIREWIQMCQSMDHRGPELKQIQQKLQERYRLEALIAATDAGKGKAKGKPKKAKQRTQEGDITGPADPASPPASTKGAAASPSAAVQPAPADSESAGPSASQSSAAALQPTLPTPPRSISATSPPPAPTSSLISGATPDIEMATAEDPGSRPAQLASTSTLAPAAPASASVDIEADRTNYKRAWLYEYLPAAEAAKASPQDFTIDVCTEIEAEYWRTLGELRSTGGRAVNRPVGDLSRGALYGADQCGTLFDQDMAVWNIGKLDNPLTRMLGCINEHGEWVAPQIDADGEVIEQGPRSTDVKGKGKAKVQSSKAKAAAAAAPVRLDDKSASVIAGVTTPYLYFGMWQATFSWHVEDMDLCSINYIHFGAPKQWYAIPQEKCKRFETAMATIYPSDARRCSQFLRHKSYLAIPSRLASIRPLKLVQHAGEIVLTFPYGYHSGFNLGFNCAESTNFALDDWLKIGMDAKVCECADREQQVYIDVKKLYADAMEAEKLERKRAREMDGDYVEEQDEDDEGYIDAKARVDRNGKEDDEVGKGSRSVPPPPLKPPAKPKRKVHVAKRTGAGTKAMTQAAAAAHEAEEGGSSSEELSSAEEYESAVEEVDNDIAGSDVEYGSRAKPSKSARTTKAATTPATASGPSTSTATTSPRAADEDGGEAIAAGTSSTGRVSLKHLTPEERRLHKNALGRKRWAEKKARKSC
ncbi:hypothetical protein V8E36_003319 [Tilletia maclaganii]